LEISVMDMGRGIPNHIKGLLFDRFKQVEIRDAQRGSGLGLAISKTIIDQHGGKIGFDSQVGVGSRFWFRLPIAVSGESGLPADDPMITEVLPPFESVDDDPTETLPQAAFAVTHTNGMSPVTQQQDNATALGADVAA